MTDLEGWYSDLDAGQKQVALELRKLVFAQGKILREELKWNQPCFYANSMVCYIGKAKKHVAFGFAKGAELPDPDELLEGSGNQIRHVKIPLGSPLRRTALERLVRHAIALDG